MLDLARLVYPKAADEFVRDHWPSRPYWSGEGGPRLEALREIPELESAEAVLTSAPRVMFFRPDGGSGVVSADKALTVYRLGLTCFVGCAHIPPLMEMAESLAAELGLPAGSMTCEAFCSSGQSGVTMHSDHDVNFAVQVSGNKRWRLAVNRHIRNQTAVCRPPSHPQHDPGQLELADELPFPERMPDDAEVVEVGPGGMLFLPRGWWHETRSSGDCLQVNFVFNRPMWVDVLTRALLTELRRDPAWREYAYDLFGPAGRQEAALQRFAGLLAGVRERLVSEDPRTLAAELVDQAGLRPARRP